MRAWPDLITAAAEGAWTGQSKEARLEGLREDFRLYLAFQMPDAPALEELDDAAQFLVTFAGARSRILGFLWERTYGDSMQHLAASWTPMSDEELAAVFENVVPNSDLDPFTQAALDAISSIHGASEELIQPIDKVVASASLRAGARVAQSLASWPEPEDEESELEIIERFRDGGIARRGGPTLQRAVAALSGSGRKNGGLRGQGER